ncbi:hypothetical protein SAMN04487969_12844 [Paenibacillus algorifonticola]|uniref:Uncharacterized protein n=1 Tax=Paenibacillus algorifonticola TaxID=684063 RepID=A0A1I2I114_9BACL|nr:hypothetical protein [Paenibacillus algorifonticola]SFF34777.1 hypothetical protein SAMN04487969_12844 [Paenibacillus algorifonticola]
MFIIICLAGIILTMIVLKKTGALYIYSKGVFISVILTLIAAICLSQNYLYSLIPSFEDGIAISNFIAYWIIGDDGWSVRLFQQYSEGSILLAIGLLVFYIIVLSVELAVGRKTARR